VKKQMRPFPRDKWDIRKQNGEWYVRWNGGLIYRAPRYAHAVRLVTFARTYQDKWALSNNPEQARAVIYTYVKHMLPRSMSDIRLDAWMGHMK
jgi:hypothetical protein